MHKNGRKNRGEADLNNEIKGLSDEEVAFSRAKNGENTLGGQTKVSFFKKLIKNLSDPIIRILIVAFFVTLLFSGGDGSYIEAIGIAASVLISTLVSTVSEYGSEKAFRRMQTEAAKQSCNVVRNARSITVSVEELVVGDCVSIRAGDRVGADGILISGNVGCDMSSLNGESTEERKEAVSEESELGVPNDGYSLFRGALVTSGSGIMLVRAVGRETYYGRIAGELQEQGETSPLRQKLDGLAKTLSKFGYFCAACVALAYLLCSVVLDRSFVFSTRNLLLELLHALTLAVSVVVVAVPEGLPMMITVVLSSNMIRMQKQNIRVRKPVGIETAGNVQILFTDKTGTLTYGEPKVVSYVTGAVNHCRRSLDLGKEQRFLLGLCAIYGGESRIESFYIEKKRKAVQGDATERALLTEFLSGGDLPKAAIREAYLPFDSRRKFSAATVEFGENTDKMKKFGQKITLIKGAPEILIKYCNSCYGCDGKRESFDKNALFSALDAFTSKGGRAIAVVSSEASAETVERASKSEESDLSALFENACFLCLVCIRDEVRREAPKAISRLKNAGIQTVMITGDCKSTAVAIAKETGILDGGLYETVIESAEMRKMSDEALEKILPSLRVVARALPDDKSRLVKIAKKCGKITAMTGDGLNDAPALKAADVGFAMGNGTDVAKEAGDIIINSSDISSIVLAVLYGRTIFRSIRKFIVFQLIMNLSAVGISIIGPFIGFESPVTVTQMLWINLIMDTLAALAFAGEAPSLRYMRERPVPKDEAVLSGDMITKIFVMGVYTVMVCLFFCNSPYIKGLFGGFLSEAFLSGFFALFVFCGVFGAFCARSARINIFSGLFGNPVFVSVIAAVFLSQVGMIYFAGAPLRCVPLSIKQLKTVLLLASTVVPAGIALEFLMKVNLKNAPVMAKKAKKGGVI